jgi:cytochrome c2
MKTSIALAVIGAMMLLASVVPWPIFGSTLPEPAVSPVVADAGYGRQLFVTKGCTGCHRHTTITTSGRFAMDGPPDLTHYEPDPAFVREWLRDPQAIRPGTSMPDLNLSDPEIEALIAFLSE